MKKNTGGGIIIVDSIMSEKLREEYEMKKFLVALLCAATMIGSLPITAFAEGISEPESYEKSSVKADKLVSDITGAIDTMGKIAKNIGEEKYWKDVSTGISVTTSSDEVPANAKLVAKEIHKGEDSELSELFKGRVEAYEIYLTDENGKKIESKDSCKIKITLEQYNYNNVYYVESGKKHPVYQSFSDNRLTRIIEDEIRPGKYVFWDETMYDSYYETVFEDYYKNGPFYGWSLSAVKPETQREAIALFNAAIRDNLKQHGFSYKFEFNFGSKFNPENVLIILNDTEGNCLNAHQTKIEYIEDGSVKENAEKVANKLVAKENSSGEKLYEYYLEDLSLINYYFHNGSLADGRLEEPENTALNYVPGMRRAVKGTDMKIKIVPDKDKTTENTITGVPVIYRDENGEETPCYVPDLDMKFGYRNVIYVPKGQKGNFEKAARERLDQYLGEGSYIFKKGGEIKNLKDYEEIKESFGPDYNNLTGKYYTLEIGGVSERFFLYKIPAEKITTPEFVFSDSSNTGLKFISRNVQMPLDAKMEVSYDESYGEIRYTLRAMYNNGEEGYLGGNYTVEIPRPFEINPDKLEIYTRDSDWTERVLKYQVRPDKFDQDIFNDVLVINDWIDFNGYDGAAIILREAEYSDIFNKIAPDGIVTFNSVKPESDEEFGSITSYLGRKKVNDGYRLGFELIKEGNYEEAIMTVSGESYEESHRVKIKYNEPDEKWVEEAEAIKEQIKPGITGDWDINKIPYSLEDTELLSYLKHRTFTENNNGGLEEGSNNPMLYLSEIRNIVETPDVYFVRSLGAGDTLDIASEMASYDAGNYLICQGEYVCAVGKDAIASRHIIYIPDDSEDIMAAAKERLNDSLGEGEYSFTVGGKLEDLKWKDVEFNSGGAFDEEKIAGDSYYHLTIDGKTYQFLIYKIPTDEIPSPVFNETDKDTNVSVISDGSSLPLDAKLIVKKNDDAKIADRLGTDNYTAFDVAVISPTYGGEIKNVDGTITVKLPISTELTGEDLGIYFISERGIKKEYDYEIESGYAVFKADEIGTYAIAEKKDSGDDKPTDPGDNNPGGNQGGTGESGGSGSGGTSTPSVTKDRVSGANRFQTAINVANELKGELGIVKFNNIVVANSDDYADALSATALAADKKAPILVVNKNNETTVKNYITSNLVKGGNVYIIGGTAAVSEKFEDSLTGYKVTRLGGADRFATNIAVLKALGVSGASDIMVAYGFDFADALSASATGEPVLLVGKTLTADQLAYLKGLGGNDDYYVIGGTSAVNATVMNQLKAANVGDVTRLGGTDRYETGLAVAEEFFGKAKTVVVASGNDFPDGLTGGVLANAMDAPLLLVNQYNTSEAADFVDDNSVRTVVAIGGTSAISNATLNKVA